MSIPTERQLPGCQRNPHRHGQRRFKRDDQLPGCPRDTLRHGRRRFKRDDQLPGPARTGCRNGQCRFKRQNRVPQRISSDGQKNGVVTPLKQISGNPRHAMPRRLFGGACALRRRRTTRLAAPTSCPTALRNGQPAGPDKPVQSNPLRRMDARAAWPYGWRRIPTVTPAARRRGIGVRARRRNGALSRRCASRGGSYPSTRSRRRGRGSAWSPCA